MLYILAWPAGTGSTRRTKEDLVDATVGQFDQNGIDARQDELKGTPDEKKPRQSSNCRGLLQINSRRRPSLPRSRPRSTIGPEGLNFRVRDGNGCDPLGKITEKLVFSRPAFGRQFRRIPKRVGLLKKSFKRSNRSLTNEY